MAPSMPSVSRHTAAMVRALALPLATCAAEPFLTVPIAQPASIPPPRLAERQRVNPTVASDDELRTARDAGLAWRPVLPAPGEAVHIWES
jgi:hypothetical protein